jgi:hypothetical protein
MPYSSSGGSSGIAHLACAYGLPIIASDIPDFHQLADEEGLAIEYFTPGDIPALANRLLALLKNPERQMEMALQNVSAALRMSMPEIMRQYLRTFTLRRHIDCLGSVSRLRRIPRWLPLRQTLVRTIGKRSFHQQLEYPVLEPAFEDAMASLNGNGQLSGGVLTTRVSVDGDGVAFGSGSSRGILDAAIPDAATAQHSDGNAEGADGQELTDSLPRTHSSGHH